MSSVALAVCDDNALTSVATTAKPFPASPARAASIVAFNASRLVCPAMVWIKAMTSPIFCEASTNRPTMASVRVACSTALWAIDVDWVTCRAISWIEDDSSSAEAATV